MQIMQTCNHCGFKSYGRWHVKFYKCRHKEDINHPYDFHYGVECGSCGIWIKWEKQTDEIIKNKFYTPESFGERTFNQG